MRKTSSFMTVACAIAGLLCTGESFALSFEMSKNSSSKSYNYRDSGSGRYMKKDTAQRRSPATVEKERRRTK
jgi:hypothetical protein